jgi:hypothetical protein
MLLVAEKGVGVAPGGRGVVVECMLQSGFPGVWTGPVWAVGHPFAAQGGMECYDRYGRSGSIRRDDLAICGGHDHGDLRPTAGGMAHALRRSSHRMCPSRSP